MRGGWLRFFGVGLLVGLVQQACGGSEPGSANERTDGGSGRDGGGRGLDAGRDRVDAASAGDSSSDANPAFDAGGGTDAVAQPAHGHAWSLPLTLPPLGVLFLAPRPG